MKLKLLSYPDLFSQLGLCPTSPWQQYLNRLKCEKQTNKQVVLYLLINIVLKNRKPRFLY